MQGSVASFHFRNELSLRRATYSGRARKGPGKRAILAQAGRQAGKWAERQADLAQAARLHVAVEVTWAECVCASI